MSLSSTNSGENVKNEESNFINMFYNYDWSSTSLGPIDTWDPALKNVMNLSLNSKFPICIFMNPPDWITIYNEAYVPTLMTKHPEALEMRLQDLFPECFELRVKYEFNKVITTGKGIYGHDERMEFKRDGYTEEFYVCNTFNPVFKSDGKICAILCLVQNTTQKVINTRRLNTISEFGNHISGVESLESACHIIKKVLSNNKDIPYTLIYLIKHTPNTSFESLTAHLIAMTFDDDEKGRNFPNYLPETPETIDLAKDANKIYDTYIELKRGASTHSFLKCESWPIYLALKEKNHVKVLLKDDYRAILLSTKISQSWSVVLIYGVNKFHTIDEKHMEFLQLVTNQINIFLHQGISIDEEMERTKILADLNYQKIVFSQGISHELKTPLTLMISPLDDVINACSQKSSIMTHLQIIRRNARRLLKLINALLQFSEIENNQLKARYREINIVEFTQELASEFKGSNAFKHTWNGQIAIRLYIDYKENKKMLVLEVSDTGVGIPESALPNLFQRFYRAESQGSRSHEGTGIGLTLVKELITLHGGDITVSSVVLIVDDNNDMRDYLADLLREFDIYRARDGQDAIRALKMFKKLPDLILSDIMDGYELLDVSRSDIKTLMIPVILLSANACEDSKIKGLDKGANDFLVKPFSARELISRIRANIELSHLRRKIFFHRYKQEDIKQLLLSVTNTVFSKIDLNEILLHIAKETYRRLPCEKLFIISNEQSRNNKIVVPGEEDSECLVPITNPFSEISNHNKSNSQAFTKLQNSGVNISLDVYCEDLRRNVSILSVEVMSNNGNWGWIKIYRSPNSIWSDSEIEFLQQISNQISMVVLYAKLIEENMEKEIQIKAAEIASSEKSQTLANTSHELRTPLGTIVGIASSFESTNLTTDQRDMLNIISSAADIVLSIANDILHMAKLEAKKVNLVHRTFDLLELLESTIDTFGKKAGTKKLELIVNCEVEILPRYVKSDPERLKQVLSHLLSNS
ncbi:protein-histidine kinase [Gigaspora margarita]|uniref:Protein-histidine kinase n=1 Tax=Gigaspora margarita TaxID=4874 RepID=A0A8H3X762_GIGMA|nr:protein-histidine kinase [Gigaspora margarita]